MASLVFRNISFSYPGSPVCLLDSVAVGISEGWTGVIGANGTGKTTFLQLATGLLDPDIGLIHRPGDAAYCPQRTDDPLPELATLLDSMDGHAYRIRGSLEIEDDYLKRWDTLSHGERKRAQIGACLWMRPTLLAIDEPTNHLDSNARAMVFNALRSYTGIGLLVSHDRDLLDQLCEHCLFIEPPHVTLHSGGYTRARASREQENEHAINQKVKATRDRVRMEREFVTRRRHQHKADKARSKRGIDRKDHDAKAKVNLARFTDSGAGKNMRQLEGRIQQAQSKEDSFQIRKQRATGIRLSGQRSHRNALFRIESGQLALGEDRHVRFPDLLMQSQDRIAIIGPNGGGKSTLVRHIMAYIDLPSARVVYIPQEITAGEAAVVLRETKNLVRRQLGEVMRWVSRLGSDPHQLLESLVPSPGEVRKLMLALRMSDQPVLVVMDEPTNHIDLPSIECLESALGEYEGGLLLVSHDERFLSQLTDILWDIRRENDSATAYAVHVRVRGLPRHGGIDPLSVIA